MRQVSEKEFNDFVNNLNKEEIITDFNDLPYIGIYTVKNNKGEVLARSTSYHMGGMDYRVVG